MMQKKEGIVVTVLDVGAWGGASTDWRVIGNFIRLVGFEPNEEECDRLNMIPASSVRSQTFYPYVISGGSGERCFHITRRPTVSSLYKPIKLEWARYGMPGSSRNRRAEVVNTIGADTITLDEFCDKHEIVPDFVKIDTQGSELEILKDGFQKYINDLLGLEVEVEFVPLYENQPLFSEVELFLRQKGFQVFGLKRHMWKMNDGTSVSYEHGGRLIFGDALFLNGAIFDGELSEEKALKSALLAYRYGLHDVAQVIISIYEITDTCFQHALDIGKRFSGSSTSLGFQKFLSRLLDRQIHPDRGTIVEFDEEYGF